MHGVDASGHIREFLDAISWKLGHRLRFDPSSESFIDEPEADALRYRPRREPFTI